MSTVEAYRKLMSGTSSTGNAVSKYFAQLHSKAPHLRKSDVMAYRDYIVIHGPKLDVPDSPKNDKMALEIRLEADQSFNRGDLGVALNKYRESICWATNGSRNLGLSYAKCSAVFYAMDEYEFALLCIVCAKWYDYPVQFMTELLVRETNCRRKIMGDPSRLRLLSRSFMFNVERNPKIPFLAAGIIMKKLPEYGRSMVADREFRAGAVILEEKMLACSVNPTKKYEACNYCGSYAPLIPCLRCTSVIYCSVKCWKAGMKSSHRFECGISEKLDHISYGASRIGLRMFFHGLTLFDDDVDKMMAFCQAYVKTEADPFTLDYSKYNPLEEFKVFHQTKVPDIGWKEDSIKFHAALYYSVVIEHPPVRDLVKTEAQKGFMLQCIYDFMRTAMFLASYQLNLQTFQLYSIAAVCNHSCIPNTYAVSHGGIMKFVVLRPIEKGEQILTSYNISNAKMGHDVSYPMNFQCICMVCDPRKRWTRIAISAGIRLPDSPSYEFDGTDIDLEVLIMQSFMNQYGHLHWHPDFDRYIRKYRAVLRTDFLLDSAFQLRNPKAADYEKSDGK